MADSKDSRPKQGGLQRKTPLQRGNTPLKRGKPLKSDPSKGLRRTGFQSSPEKIKEQWAKQSLARKQPLPKPAKERATPAKPRKRPSRPTITAEEKKCRATVAERSEGMCEKCGLPGALEKAHRIARSQGGRWEASNVLDLCHFCHHGNHATPESAYDHGWHLRGHTADTQTAPVLFRKGWKTGWAVLDNDGGYEWVDGPVWDDTLMHPHNRV